MQKFYIATFKKSVKKLQRKKVLESIILSLKEL